MKLLDEKALFQRYALSVYVPIKKFEQINRNLTARACFSIIIERIR